MKDWKKFLEDRLFAAQALVFLAAVIAFAPALSNGFVYDDLPQIIENPFVTNPHMWRSIFAGNVWSFAGEPTNFYRPLQALFYWVLYRLAGANPAPFHLLNLLFYGATACVIFEIGRRLLKDPGVAFLGAMIWVVHPVHVEAVTWISCLPDLGAGLFFLLAFNSFLRAEEEDSGRLKGTLLAAAFYFVALFFKEMAATFPLLVLVYWFFLGRKESWKFKLARWLPYMAALVVYGFIRYKALGYLTIKHNLLLPPSRVIKASIGLLGQNAKDLLWPVHLNVFRVFDMKASLLSLWPWVTLAVILAAILLRKRNPKLAFLIVWWPVTMLPALAFAYLLFEWFPRCVPMRRAAAVAFTAFAVLAVIFIHENLHLIPTWNGNEALYAYSMQLQPNSALVHMAKGVELEYRYNDLDGALAQFNEAWKLNAESSWPLGIAPDYYLEVGRIALIKGHRQEAIEDFEKTLKIDPRRFAARDALGAIYFPEGDYAKAASYFSVSVELNPQDLGALFYLGMCYMKLGKFRQAAEQFHAAREVDPGYRQAFQAEVRALEAAGDNAAAAKVSEQIPKP